MRRYGAWWAVAAMLACGTWLGAQDTAEPFCTEGNSCVDDTLEILFTDTGNTGPSVLTLAKGQTDFMVTVATNTVSENVQGWSYAIAHDPDYVSVGDNTCARGMEYVCNTDAEGVMIGPFVVSTAVAGGVDGDGNPFPPGFISAVVLSLIQQTQLPTPQRNSIARVPYNVVASPPAGGTMLRFVNGLVRNAPSPPVSINITIDGQARLPRTFIQGLILGGDQPVEDCSTPGDEDGNDLADCADPVCFGPSCPEVCDDGQDNDGDGQTDGDDPDCQPMEICDNEQDDDGDGQIDCQDSDCPPCPVEGDWAFAFGTNGDGATVINMKNALNAFAFQLGVSTAGGMLTFSGDLGHDATRIVELLITDINGDSHDVSNGLVVGDPIAFTDSIGGLSRGAAIAAFEGGDFFAFDLDPGVGGPGFTVGYVSDLDSDDNQIAATKGDAENEVIVLGGPAAEPFSRGDADGNGRLNVTDAVLIIQIAIANLQERFDCDDALDANDDGRHTIADAIPVLAWIFQRGPRLAEPFLACGQDGTDDALTCAERSAFCQ